MIDASSPGQKRDLDEVLKASQRAAVLTRQLMLFSRREKLEPQILDLNGVISEAGFLLRRPIGPGVEIAFHSTTRSARLRGTSARSSRSSSTSQSTRGMRCPKAAA
jgi:hypothetical protein